MHSFLLLTTLLLPFCHAHRPDTVPDTELRTARPIHLLEVEDPDEDDYINQTPITIPFRLPEVPSFFNPRPYDYVEEVDYDDYDDDHVHFSTAKSEAVTDAESSTAGLTTDDADELDGQQERLENSTTKNCICWRLVVVGTCLLCIISSFMLS